jgi:hypothetical protein
LLLVTVSGATSSVNRRKPIQQPQVANIAPSCYNKGMSNNLF